MVSRYQWRQLGELMFDSPCLARLLVLATPSVVRRRFEWSNALLVTYGSQTLGIDCQKAADRVRLERIQVIRDTLNWTNLQIANSLMGYSGSGLLFAGWVPNHCSAVPPQAEEQVDGRLYGSTMSTVKHLWADKSAREEWYMVIPLG